MVQQKALHGPQSFSEILFSVRFIVCQFLGEGAATWDEFKKTSGVVLTTDYSGIGSPEIACAFIVEALRHHGHLSTTQAASFVLCWRACELVGSCRSVLADHHDAFAPKHIMGDLLERLPACVKTSLSSLYKKHLNAFTKAWAHGAGAKQCNKSLQSSESSNGLQGEGEIKG